MSPALEQTWSHDRIDKLGALLSNGYSASQAASEMGCSRNAVIGIARRKKLVFEGQYVSWRPRMPSARAPSPKAAKPQRKTPFRPPVRRLTNYGNRLSVVEVRAPAPLPAEEVTEIPIAQRRGLLELDGTTCRWPHGDPGAPDFYFCGAAPLEGKPYCLHHCRLGYQQPGERRGAAA